MENYMIRYDITEHDGY